MKFVYVCLKYLERLMIFFSLGFNAWNKICDLRMKEVKKMCVSFYFLIIILRRKREKENMFYNGFCFYCTFLFKIRIIIINFLLIFFVISVFQIYFEFVVYLKTIKISVLYL